jgi:hypothetical protein
MILEIYNLFVKREWRGINPDMSKAVPVFQPAGPERSGAAFCQLAPIKTAL